MHKATCSTASGGGPSTVGCAARHFRTAFSIVPIANTADSHAVPEKRERAQVRTVASCCNCCASIGE